MATGSSYADAIPITLGVTNNSFPAPNGSSVHYYKITGLNRSDEIEIYTLSDLDLYLRVFDFQEVMIGNDDDNGVDANPLLTMRNYEGYYIRISGYNDNRVSGNYSLHLEKFVAPSASSVKLSRTAIMTVPNRDFDIYAEVFPYDANQDVVWSSSNSSVAIYDADTHKIKALKLGTAVISATTVDGGFVASCTVEVTNLPTFGGGSGTEEDPYLIRNADDLNAIRLIEPLHHFRQVDDIDLSAYRDWTPLMNISGNFLSFYNGGSFAIKNLKTTGVGLFELISGTHNPEVGNFVPLVIQNVNIVDAVIINEGTCGIFAPYIYNCNIINCHVSGTVNGMTCGGFAAIAGNGSIFDKCSVSKLTLIGKYVGGFCDSFSEGVATNISVEGSMTIKSGGQGGSFARAINMEGTSVNNCIMALHITVEETNYPYVYPIGDLYTGATINSCYVDVTIGITKTVWQLGRSYGRQTYVRGSDNNVYHCHTHQNENDTTYDDSWGENPPFEWWNKPNIAAEPGVGARWREYWELVDESNTLGARTTSQMYNRSTYVGWDMESIWFIEDGASYPKLIRTSGENQWGTPYTHYMNYIHVIPHVRGTANYMNAMWFYMNRIYTYPQNVRPVGLPGQSFTYEVGNLEQRFHDPFQGEDIDTVFLFSGIMDFKGPGGYAFYTDEKVRTVSVHPERAAVVQFYFVEPKYLPITGYKLSVSVGGSVLDVLTSDKVEDSPIRFIADKGKLLAIPIVDPNDEKALPIRVVSEGQIKAFKKFMKFGEIVLRDDPNPRPSHLIGGA